MSGALRLALSTLLLGAVGAAQAASGSQSYFLSAVDIGSGGRADSAIYNVTSSAGGGLAVDTNASSSTYQFRGGFFGALTAPTLGSPWITGASPIYIKPAGNPALTLHGTDLAAGTQPVITVGTVQAPFVSRSVSQVQVTVPPQPIPGYQTVTFANSSGTTRLEAGVGVLPMIDTREPLNGWDPNVLRFHVTQGDFVIFGLASSLFPAGFQIADWNYRLLLEPNDILLTDSYFVGDPEGKLNLTIPAFFPSGQVYCQAVVLTNDPTYAPASFTNVIPL